VVDEGFDELMAEIQADKLAGESILSTMRKEERRLADLANRKSATRLGGDINELNAPLGRIPTPKER